MITVVAQYVARTGEGDTVASVLARHAVATRDEPGCIQFVAYRSSHEADRFLLYEQYVDEAAFSAHRATPHFQSYVEGAIVPLLAERSWERYEDVEAGHR